MRLRRHAERAICFGEDNLVDIVVRCEMSVLDALVSRALEGCAAVMNGAASALDHDEVLVLDHLTATLAYAAVNVRSGG